MKQILMSIDRDDYRDMIYNQLEGVPESRADAAVEAVLDQFWGRIGEVVQNDSELTWDNGDVYWTVDDSWDEIEVAMHENDMIEYVNQLTERAWGEVAPHFDLSPYQTEEN